MSTADIAASSIGEVCESCQLQEVAAPQQLELTDTDFDLSRTYALLTAVLVLPMYLALSVVSYSLGAIL